MSGTQLQSEDAPILDAFVIAENRFMMPLSGEKN
jgi:hypothetical protein